LGPVVTSAAREPPASLSTSEAVRAEYVRRREQRRAEKAQTARLDRAISNGRLVVFGIGAAMAWLAVGRGLFSVWWIVVPAVVFLALAIRHEAVLQSLKRATRAVAFYESGLWRLEDNWAGTGSSGTRFADPHHPYSEDLDLFGTGSLFELLCTARTRAGEDCLAEWLRSAAEPETVLARQAAVAELRPRLDLREDLALLGEEVRAAISPDMLTAWGADPVTFTAPSARLTAALLAAVTLAALAGWALGYGYLPFVCMTLLSQSFDASLRGRVKRIVKAVEKPARDLELLSLLLARLETERFQAPLLLAMRAELDMDGKPPSARIARLQTLVEWLDAKNNQLFAPVAALLLWTTQFAFAIEGWRAENGPRLGRWLRVVGEFEALSALAGYACEHPEDPFPEIATNGVCYHAEGLAHPLIPVAQAVRNDIRIGDGTRLFIVSGSNMSGKSTLLRAIGVNAALALAGGPVRARRLRLAPIHIGASIRTQDSLQAGISRFYAEITRLRQIVDIAQENPPLLFLLDEILHGTNSHDRRIGAEAVARTLVTRGAIGLMTTHDLALARIADDPAHAAANVHFEDHLEDGKMRFDYLLRPGVVEKSNALELMRAVGLEV
jgi:hypothetical protein